MHDKFSRRIERALERLSGRLARSKKPLDPAAVNRRIGRILQQNQRAAARFAIALTPDPCPAGFRLSVGCKASFDDWAALSEGAYLLRSNIGDWSDHELWKAYIQLTQAEAAFRIQKDQLNLRPIGISARTGSRPTSSCASSPSRSGRASRCGSSARALETRRDLSWPTSTCTKCSTSGRTNGGDAMPGGRSSSVRYADDIVAGFEHKADAERFWADMKERMARFALTVHPDKTRLIEFGRFAAANRERRGEGKPETFDFLGFTHICGRNRRGGFLLRRKSRRDRMRAKLREIKEELRRHWHASIPEQGSWLKRVVGGWYNYHAVPTNIAALSSFRYLVGKLWLRALRRRSQKERTTWAKMRSILDRWLPTPRILRPWPRARFAVKHPRWEPDALIGLVRFCAGAPSNGRPYRDWIWVWRHSTWVWRHVRLGLAPRRFGIDGAMLTC